MEYHFQWWHLSPLYVSLIWAFLKNPKVLDWIKDRVSDWLSRGNNEKDCIQRAEYEARNKEFNDGHREIRELIIGSEDRMQAAFHGSVQEFKTSLNSMDEKWDRRMVMLEKTFLDDRLRGKQ